MKGKYVLAFMVEHSAERLLIGYMNKSCNRRAVLARTLRSRSQRLPYFPGVTPWTSFIGDFTVLGLSVTSSSESFSGKGTQHRVQVKL